MEVEIDNPYCVVLADTMQTDLYSYNNRVFGGVKVVFPEFIGTVSWLKPNKKPGLKWNMKTRKRENVEEDILYNYKIGTFNLPQGDKTQHFEITARFLNVTFDTVDAKKLAETHEHIRKNKQNQHDVETVMTMEDKRNREQQAQIAEEKADIDLVVSNASLEHAAQEKDRRHARQETAERERERLMDAARDGRGDQAGPHEDEDEKLAREFQREETHNYNEEHRELRAKQDHERKLTREKKEAADKQIQKNRQKELDEVENPPQAGMWARSKNFFKRSKPEDPADKYKVSTDKTPEAPSAEAAEAGWG